jgi:diguanylate cyclase (GGDEF)-like protein
MADLTAVPSQVERVINLPPAPLNVLPGRGPVFGSLGKLLASNRPTTERVVVMLLDVDDFYEVNDRLGTAVGDELLATVAERMQETVGRDGVVGHFGGDLFTIVSSRLPDDEATTRLAGALVAAVARPMRLGRGDVSLNASVGISVSQGHDDTSETLLRNANIALHEAKERAQGGTVVFDSGRHDRDVQHLHTASDLQRALDRDEFLLHYQPVVSLETGLVASFEALVRWQHPERGLLLPHEFITHAEHSGVIGRLGAWVLEEACRTTVHSSTAEPVDRWNLSVNLSPRQLADPSFPTMVADMLGRTGMDPDRLSLEITETTLMLDAPWATGALEALRDLGIHIAVDDFGTGYSCLAYLRSLPVDTLKIDRYFVEGIGSDPASTAICAAIVALADALDLETIAEGVETEEQLSQLRDLGCRLGQGHLFGRALPADQRDDMGSLPATASR